jgi:hypothetical protein
MDLSQRNPDSAATGRKFHAGLNSPKRDGHAYSVAQSQASRAADPSTAAAKGVVCAGKVLYLVQARDAPVSHIAEAPSVTPTLKP